MHFIIYNKMYLLLLFIIYIYYIILYIYLSNITNLKLKLYNMDKTLELSLYYKIDIKT